MDCYIMSGDKIVGKWENQALVIVDKNIAPMYLLNTGNVSHWVETRAIDCHRANSRLLKKALRLTQSDDFDVALSVYAATITDNYWVKPFNSDLKYKDICFNNNYFAKLALRGDYDSFIKAASGKNAHTPELTNIGSFEKCWRLKKGDWQMIKSAGHNQQFSEIFIYELGKRLGFNMAEYSRGKGSVITADFTRGGKYNFEPAYSFMGDDEDYASVVSKLREIAPRAVPDYIRMIFMDTIIANPDRHTFNFGLLRDPKTGKIISLAPNFDNNMALIARGYPKNIKRAKDILINYFNDLMKFDPSLERYIPAMSEDDIKSALKKVNMKVKSDIITRFIMNGYERIISKA